MRDKRFEKQCALLTLGGENLLGVRLTDLRRNAIPMFKSEGNMTVQWKSSVDFLQELWENDMKNECIGMKNF